MKLSEMVTNLEALFDLLNSKYFESKIPQPIITIQSRPKAYGHCTTKEVWRGELEKHFEINLSAEHLRRPYANIAATMLHEMVHLYCLVNSIEDTCQGGRYHNKRFKREAEARDLRIEYDSTIGYSLTAPTDNLINTLKHAGCDTDLPLARERITVPDPAKPKKTRVKKVTHTYVCPVCLSEVKACADKLSLICGDDGSKYILKEGGDK